MRQDKPHWFNDVWGFGEKHFALGQRFTHQAEFVVLQVAQATMDQLAAG